MYILDLNAKMRWAVVMIPFFLAIDCNGNGIENNHDREMTIDIKDTR